MLYSFTDKMNEEVGYTFSSSSSSTVLTLRFKPPIDFFAFDLD